MSGAKLFKSEKVARHLESFKEFSELTGIPVEDLLAEALEDYIECSISSRTESIAERAASA